MSVTHIPVALRRRVHERASARCEYCCIPEVSTLVSHQVDHIVAEKHGGATEEQNLALSCTLCNRHKGTDLTTFDPETGELVLLFHPRHDRWQDHFRLDGAHVVPLTAIGRATNRLLQLNRSDRIAERELLLASGIMEMSHPADRRHLPDSGEDVS